MLQALQEDDAVVDKDRNIFPPALRFLNLKFRLTSEG